MVEYNQIFWETDISVNLQNLTEINALNTLDFL